MAVVAHLRQLAGAVEVVGTAAAVTGDSVGVVRRGAGPPGRGRRLMADRVVGGSDGPRAGLYRTAAFLVAPVAARGRRAWAVRIGDAAAAVAEVRITVAVLRATPARGRWSTQRVVGGRDLARARRARAAVQAIFALLRRARSAVDVDDAATAVADSVAVLVVAIPTFGHVAPRQISRSNGAAAAIFPRERA